MVSARDVAWLAGFLEGEGWFGVKGGDTAKRRSIGIHACSTDHDVLERARKIMQGRMNSKSPQPGRKPAWELHVYGARAAGWMMTLYGFMGVRRRVRIREALRIWGELGLPARFRATCPQGHPCDGVEMAHGQPRARYCKRCAVERQLAYRARKAAESGVRP